MNFTNRFTNSLPGENLDSSKQTGPHLTPDVCWSEVYPEKTSKPLLLIDSKEVRTICDLDGLTDLEFTEIFSGNVLLPGMKPFSTRYGGHQFGYWAGQLGDGRAVTLGEIKSSLGEYYEIQLKGSGKTPYSRRGDGKAVLRSSLREFLCSEAVHYLRIPTTRALSCITTGEKVLRDLFYDGNPKFEPGAITARVAPSFIRFGNFQILAANQELELLKKLIQFTINNYYSEIDSNSDEGIIEWFKSICEKTAQLMVDWLRVGFVHGVMNTDNLSILGLTIDYGPYGWLDVYDPEWTPNTTDAENRRYRYEAQPSIAFWNLSKLSESISFVLTEEKQKKLKQTLEHYQNCFQMIYSKMMLNKLGLDGKSETDSELINALDSALRSQEVDFTLFYRKLANLHLDFTLDLELHFADALYAHHPKLSPELHSWLKEYQKRILGDSRTAKERVKIMNENNPIFILRNYLVQLALEEFDAGNRKFLDNIFEALQSPYEEKPEWVDLYKKRPEWARSKPGCSALSCSS